VAFSQAVFDGEARVEDQWAVLVRDEAGMRETLERGRIPLFIDPEALWVSRLKPPALVDGIMAKRNTGTTLRDAPIVIALGPGFTVGIDCHGVVETQRGHTLGRLLLEGGAIPNTGIPGDIGGFSTERVLRSPGEGIFEGLAAIGDRVEPGDPVALVRTAWGEALPVKAGIGGVLRGLLPSGYRVWQGMKAGDIDPRCEAAHCFTVSDKALAIAGGVLEGLMRFWEGKIGGGPCQPG
jgi:xanthine dehydrogenase accessory factor